MRHPQLLHRNNAVLIVVDMQEPFLRTVHDREHVIDRVKLLIEAAKTLEIPILTTTQYAERMGPTVPEIAERLPEDPAPMDKLCFSCCGQGEFVKALAATGRKQALVCGIETHICVNQTVHDLLAMGYEPHLAADAISGRHRDATATAFDRMVRAGAVLSHSESAIYEMLREAGTPEFKAVLKLIK